MGLGFEPLPGCSFSYLWAFSLIFPSSIRRKPTPWSARGGTSTVLPARLAPPACPRNAQLHDSNLLPPCSCSLLFRYYFSVSLHLQSLKVSCLLWSFCCVFKVGALWGGWEQGAWLRSRSPSSKAPRMSLWVLSATSR